MSGKKTPHIRNDALWVLREAFPSVLPLEAVHEGVNNIKGPWAPKRRVEESLRGLIDEGAVLKVGRGYAATPGRGGT